MKKTKSIKPLMFILVIALTLCLMPVPAYSASEAHATFVQDALRKDNEGASVSGSLMTTLYDYPIGGNNVNCVGNTSEYSAGPYEQYDSALKFTLPTTTAPLVGATLRLKVLHREGNPTATVVMTNDNNWQQTNNALTSTFPGYSAPEELASGQPVTAENDWQDIPLTNLSALDAKIGASANDVTLIITGSTLLGYYFSFLADDDPSPEPGAELILEFAPVVSSVEVPSDGTYKAGDSLTYAVNFSDAVNVTGTPYLTLTIGSSAVHAIYMSGSGTKQLEFRYTVESEDKDTDGVALASNVSLGGGTIQDAAGNNATLTFTGGTATGVLVKATQTITFENPGSQDFGTNPMLVATSDSGLPVTFTSDTPGVCTITSDGVLTFVTAGPATITASQAGNSEYFPASVSRSFTVNAVVPGAPSIGPATAGDTQATVRFSAPASNGGAAITGYLVTSSPDNIALVGASSPIVITGLTNGQAYTFTVRAVSSAGTGPASAVSNSVTPKAPQTITFLSPGTQNFGTHPTLTATSDSTLPVTFTSDTPDVCTVTSDGVLTFLKAGEATISADQAGNATYLPADTVSQRFTVNAVVPGAPTISAVTAGNEQATVRFTAPAFTGGADITRYTVTSSPGGFTGTGTGSPIAVTGLTNGVAYTFTVTATNSAGTGTASAASGSATPKAEQTITFANPGAQNFGTRPTLTATSSSGLPVTFASNTPDVCTVTSTGVLTFLKAGIATISADQAGSGSYLPAETVSQSFTVSAVVPGAPTIGAVTAGNGRATVSFTPPAFSGGTDITGYTVTASTGGRTASGTASPIVVTGLINGVPYTFTVTATNSAGTGAASAASVSVTPKAAATPTPAPTATPEPMVTPSPSATPTATPVPTPAATGTPAPSPTATETPAESAPAGTRTIAGTLLSSDGNPMSGYIVELHSDPMTAVTDAKGRYSFDNVDYTSHQLIVKTPEGEKFAEFELSFTEGAKFGAEMTETGADIIYTSGTETVSIEVELLPDRGGAVISRVNGSDGPQTGGTHDGSGSILWWIGGVIVLLLIGLLIIALLRKKKGDRETRF